MRSECTRYGDIKSIESVLIGESEVLIEFLCAGIGSIACTEISGSGWLAASIYWAGLLAKFPRRVRVVRRFFNFSCNNRAQ